MLKEKVLSNNAILLGKKQQRYRQYLVEVLGQAVDYREFFDLINNEFTRYGVSDWAYTLLDTPNRSTAAEQIGTIDRVFIESYVDESLYEYDMVLQHIKLSDVPILQSDIEQLIERSNIRTNDMENYKKIINRNLNFGYENTYTIPVTCGVDGSRAAISIMSKGIGSKKFKESALHTLSDFKVFALAINDVGKRRFPEIFVSPPKKYQSISRSQAFNILIAMTEKDLSVKECANYLGISENTAHNHLKMIRKYFGVRTNYSVYYRAKKYGFL